MIGEWRNWAILVVFVMGSSTQWMVEHAYIINANQRHAVYTFVLKPEGLSMDAV
jgi:hypothetical protein